MNSFLITISLVAVFDVIGSMIAKMWMLKSNPIYLIGTFICFGIAGLFFANSLKFEGVGIANIIWTILSIIIVSTA
jgi:multidrug transporter EmrE-like cation transporter